MKFIAIRIVGVVKGRIVMLDFNAKECPPDFILWHVSSIGMIATDWYAYTMGLDWINLSGEQTIPVSVGTVRPFCAPLEKGMFPKESYREFCQKRNKKGRKRGN